MFPQLGPLEMLIIMGVAVLLFGKRLPEVGRSLGRGILEFRKGMNDVSGEFQDTVAGRDSSYGSSRRVDHDDRSRNEFGDPDSAVPKFELPGVSSSPVPQMEYQPPASQD